MRVAEFTLGPEASEGFAELIGTHLPKVACAKSIGVYGKPGRVSISLEQIENPIHLSADGIPSAIVAVHNGEPLVLLVSEETLNLFRSVAKKLDLTHTELANRLRKSLNDASGEFCEQSAVSMLTGLLE